MECHGRIISPSQASFKCHVGRELSVTLFCDILLPYGSSAAMRDSTTLVSYLFSNFFTVISRCRASPSVSDTDYVHRCSNQSSNVKVHCFSEVITWSYCSIFGFEKSAKSAYRYNSNWRSWGNAITESTNLQGPETMATANRTGRHRFSSQNVDNLAGMSGWLYWEDMLGTWCERLVQPPNGVV